MVVLQVDYASAAARSQRGELCLADRVVPDLRTRAWYGPAAEQDTM